MSSTRRASATVLCGAALCGTTGTALTSLAPNASPLGVASMRLLVGGAALTAVALAGGRRPSELRGHGRWIAAGSVAVALFQVCFFAGTKRTGVALATVIALGSAPAFSGLINAVVLRRPPTARWVCGTVLAVGGVALIARSQPSSRTDLGGIVASFGAGLGWAAYAMIGQQRIRAGLDSTTCMAALFAGGALLSTPLLAFGGTGWIITGTGIALSLYLGVVTVAVVYTCLGWGLRNLPAHTVVSLALAEPMTAAVLATLILHQAIGAAGWCGIVVVLVALVVTAQGGERAVVSPVAGRAGCPLPEPVRSAAGNERRTRPTAPSTEHNGASG